MKFWIPSTFAGLLLLLVSLPASADELMPAFNVNEIVAEQEDFRAEAIAGRGVFKDMSRDDKTLFQAQQSGLFSILRDRQYEDLDRDQRIEAFNHLEAIAAILNRARDSRMVCERIKRVGSNRVERVCKTVAQRDREREEALDSPMLRQLNTCAGGRCAGN